jgi:hypothetical protein
MTKEAIMNRIEIVGLFTSLKSHVDKNDMESIKMIVEAVLNEAVTKKPTIKETEE